MVSGRGGGGRLVQHPQSLANVRQDITASHSPNRRSPVSTPNNHEETGSQLTCSV